MRPPSPRFMSMNTRTGDSHPVALDPVANSYLKTFFCLTIYNSHKITVTEMITKIMLWLGSVQHEERYYRVTAFRRLRTTVVDAV